MSWKNRLISILYSKHTTTENRAEEQLHPPLNLDWVEGRISKQERCECNCWSIAFFKTLERGGRILIGLISFKVLQFHNLGIGRAWAPFHGEEKTPYKKKELKISVETDKRNGEHNCYIVNKTETALTANSELLSLSK